MYSRYTIPAYVLFCFLFIVMVGCKPSKNDELGWQHYKLLLKRHETQKKILEAIDLFDETGRKVVSQRAQLKTYLKDKSKSEGLGDKSDNTGREVASSKPASSTDIRPRVDTRPRVVISEDAHEIGTLRPGTLRPGTLRPKKLSFEGKSDSEIIGLFSQCKPEEIPPNLRLAYSCWKTLMPDEVQLLKIAEWIDQQQSSNILEDMDVKIKEIDNYRQLGKLLDQDDMHEIDKLLEYPINDLNITSDVNNAIYEKKAIEKLKIKIENWK